MSERSPYWLEGAVSGDMTAAGTGEVRAWPLPLVLGAMTLTPHPTGVQIVQSDGQGLSFIEAADVQEVAAWLGTLAGGCVVYERTERGMETAFHEPYYKRAFGGGTDA